MATSDTPSLHTALQREREAADKRINSIEGDTAANCAAHKAAQRATDQALAALEEGAGQLCADCANVAASGVEHDDPRLDYVTVQIDRATWRALRALYGRGGVE